MYITIYLYKAHIFRNKLPTVSKKTVVIAPFQLHTCSTLGWALVLALSKGRRQAQPAFSGQRKHGDLAAADYGKMELGGRDDLNLPLAGAVCWELGLPSLERPPGAWNGAALEPPPRSPDMNSPLLYRCLAGRTLHTP